MLIKKYFLFFWDILSSFGFKKLANSVMLIWHPKKTVSPNIDMGVKKAEFDAHIEAHEKVDKVPIKKLQAWKCWNYVPFLSFSTVY